MTFELYDKKSGTLLKKVNMSQAIAKFQSNYPKDPGRVSVSPIQFDKSVVYVITGVVISILIIGLILSMVRKR
jgi:hypothetical protein